MAQLTITVPNDKVQLILDAFEWKFGVTNAEGVRQEIIEFARRIVVEHQKEIASQDVSTIVGEVVEGLEIT